MRTVFIYLGIATLGCVLYHVGQKFLPKNINPMMILVATYTTAGLLSLALMPFFKSTDPTMSFKHAFGWPVLVVGLGVLLIEGGFLLAYRGGGSLQWSGVLVNGLAAAILIPVAIVLFREEVSYTRLLGVLVTLGGMALIGWK